MGVFARACEAICRIYKFKTLAEFLTWVDDFAFFRYPETPSLTGPWTYSYDESIIWQIADDLGWPWAKDKHFPFSTSFTYIGFFWDLVAKTVCLPDKKKEKYLRRLDGWSRNNLMSKNEADVLVGTLNHCTLVVPHGRSHLPSFYKFLSTFKPDTPSHIKHTIGPALHDDALWWRNELAKPWCGINIRIPPDPLKSEIFVDASTKWGVGFIMDGKWLAFKFVPGSFTEGRNIGWGEMVAVELAVRAIVNAGHHDCHIHIRSDNAGVVGALNVDMSRNTQENAILRQILLLFHIHKIWLTITWISTKVNPADGPSRGVFGKKSDLFPHPPKIPLHLAPYVCAPISSRSL